MDDAANIPSFLSEQICSAYPDEIAARIFDGFYDARTRPVTLRANALKATLDEVCDALSAASISFSRVPWYEDALVLGKDVCERDIWGLDIYKEGKVYLQSLSSMLPPLLLCPEPGADILDMCAAPGGKTLQIAALQPKAHITACELSHPRAEKLEHNLLKQGAKNVQVMRTDARQLDEFFSFDQILLDAPCTGSGTAQAGDLRVAKRLSPKLLDKVVRSQQQLLDRALSVLKPGGELIYSTCSVLPEENDGQVAAALGRKRHRDCELVPIKLDDRYRSGSCALPLLPTQLEGTVSIAPTRTFEGFYVAKVRKAARS